MKLERIHDNLWEIPRTGGMRVPGRIYADREMVSQLGDRGGLEQVRNVAHLPGIVGWSLAMPDIHRGYGFPIGGVAATDPEEGGVVSPGGVGYDINCGVRLCLSSLRADDLLPRIDSIVSRFFQSIPCGVGIRAGRGGGALARDELDQVMTRGAAWAIQNGFGRREDLAATEEGGCLAGADPSRISERARDRGAPQLGTLGSGNHFVELGRVEEIYHREAAAALGVETGAFTVLIHTGSRGFGHQVCDDYIRVMGRAMARYKIRLPDRQLACAPVNSNEGRAYLSAMACAANFAWANRQKIQGLAERALDQAIGSREADTRLRLLYDVCHNVAKLERHRSGRTERRLCVHRKGATRAHPPAGEASPWPFGQPVIIPGDMGTASYLCVGTERSLSETFGSTCHGAGRVLSRAAARRKFGRRDLLAELKADGITVMARGRSTLAEEMRGAYKNVSHVVEIMEQAGISRRVARLRPIGVIKG